MATEVSINDLSTWLSNQPDNTTDTPYEITITGLTTSNYNNIKTALTSNNTKYVDLSTTTIPNGVTSMTTTFYNCSSLVAPPVIPNTVTIMSTTFYNCTSLVSAPVIPNSVTDMRSTFSGCTSLVSAPVIPDSVTNMEQTFHNCTALVNVPVIPDSVISMFSTFYNCTSLVNAPEIPDSVTNMESTFYNCTALVSVPAISDSITDVSHTFSGCTSLVNAPVIPDSVTDMSYTFEGCTSLVSVPAIPNSVNIMFGTFKNCTSLVNAPTISNIVEFMAETFRGCTSLVSAPVIPNGVINMSSTFYNCTSLAYKPIIPSTVTTSQDCYFNVSTSNWKGTESQAESFLSTFFAQTTDSELQVYNDDRVTYEESIYNIDISTLSTYLAGLDPNTVSTAYKIYIRGLTSSNASDIKTALIAGNKYADLSYTTIPNGTNMENLFYDNRSGCLPLVVPPNLPTDQTSLYRTFSRCYNLREAPAIPNSYTNLSNAFSFTSITQMPELPPNVTNISRTFGSTLLTTPKEIPNSVTDMSFAFSECFNLEYFPNIPSGVTNGKEAFSACTSLRKIEEFHIPLATLRDNANFQDMFRGCTSLESIGFKVDTDKWHAYRLKFDGSSVEGKVFGIEQGQVVSTAIQNTQISQDDIRLPVLTDELWFPDSIMTDSEVEDVVEDVLNNRYTYWKKTVIDPSSKSLVMMASDPDNVVSNFLGNGEGVDVEVINNSKSITLNNDKRLIADGSGITVTLNYNSKVGAVTEIYAMQACTITYYTGQSTTQSWSMSAGTKAVFIYYSGWKLHSNYGTTNSVAVDNMQSVSSNAVAQALTGYLTTDFLSRYLIQKTTFYLTDNGTSTFNIPNNECYLFMNIHALVNPQICLVRLYQGVLRVSTIMSGANNVAITYVSGSTVQFKATGNCRGYLWKFNGAGTT